MFRCLVFIFFFVSFGCSAERYKPSIDTGPVEEHIASGCGGAVATAHPLATKAAISVLREGGNAVDAAVAASFVLSVVRPQSTGIGGGGFMLVSDENVRAYDFRERAPRAATKDMYVTAEGAVAREVVNGVDLGPTSVAGPLAAGIPGLVRGLEKVHLKYGKLSWKRLLQPAVEVAKNGFVINEELAGAAERRKELLNAYPDTCRIFCDLKEGELLVQQDLAQTLSAVGESGADAFYSLPLDVGILSKADLNSYQVRELDPISSEVFGHKVYSMPLPSSGGIHLVQMLNMVSELQNSMFPAEKETELHFLAEISRRAFHDRATELGDPLFNDISPERLYSRWYANLLSKAISDKADSSLHLPKTGGVLPESTSTTHLSVVDGNNMAVSSTQTINYGFGSGYVVPGTGVLLNNEMDDFSVAPGIPNSFGLVGSEKNFVEPGKTPLSSMSPTILKDSEGKLVAALGSPDGPRIITAVFRVVYNYIVKNLSAAESVFQCRTHHQFLPDALYLESCVDSSTREALTSFGHELKEASRIGDIQAVFVKNNQLTAVSDIRSIGRPEVLRECSKP